MAESDRSGGPTGRPTTADEALRRCLAVGPTEFLDSYWGTKPLLSPAERLPAGFTDLLDLAGVDELLSRRGLRTPFLRVAREGRMVPVDRYTGPGGAGAEIPDQVLDERVLTLFDGGATLVLQGLHRLWPPLVEFAGSLAGQLRHPVQVNAYLTPPGSRGFATHYDTHDVFVLQCAGTKRWRVHPPVLPDPLERQPWGGLADEVAATAEAPPVLDVVLRAGDALYLPRGWLHAAQTLGEQSLHLTVGVRTITRYALVEALLDLATEEPRLRRSVPPGVEVADPDQIAAELADTVEALRDWLAKADPVAVAERLRRRYWPAGRPAPIRPVAQAAAIRDVDGDTRLMVRPGLRWRLLDPGGDRVAVQVSDRTLDAPSWCAPALLALLNGEVSRVADLPELDREDQITLARRLLREAFVVPAR